MGAKHTLQNETTDPGRHQRQTSCEKRMNYDPRRQDNQRHTPIPKARDVFSKVVGGRETNVREKKQCYAHPKIRRIENMLTMAIPDRSAQNDFRANGKDDGEDQRPKPFVRVEQHPTRKSRDQASRKKIEESSSAAGKSQVAVPRPGVYPIQEH